VSITPKSRWKSNSDFRKRDGDFSPLKPRCCACSDSAHQTESGFHRRLPPCRRKFPRFAPRRKRPAKVVSFDTHGLAHAIRGCSAAPTPAPPPSFVLSLSAASSSFASARCGLTRAPVPQLSSLSRRMRRLHRLSGKSCCAWRARLHSSL
jgi:hypothetical protein